MSVDTGASLQFNPGSALGFDIQLSDHEEEEDAEEEKKRDKEIGDLLTNTTAFDDLKIEDECETSVDVSDAEDSRMLYLKSNIEKPIQRGPFKKQTETSTPLHEVPQMDIDYTPIERPQNPALLPFHLRNQNGSGNTSFENMNFIESLNVPGNYLQRAVQWNAREQYLEPGRSHRPVLRPAHSDSDGLKEKLDYFSAGDVQEVTTVADEPDRSDTCYQQNVDDILDLKEQLLRQRQESQEVIRSLKDELTLLKGEKERVSFSLQQARELLISKSEEVQSVQLRVEQLVQDLQVERTKTIQLSEKLEASESVAESLQTQVYDLSSLRNHAKRVESQEKLMKNMQVAHAAEVEKLNCQLDDKMKELDVMQKRVHQLEQYQEQTLPSKMQGIDKLTLNLETVQKYCTHILSSEAFHDVDVLRIHQLEDERTRNQQKQEIESLMATISSLNQKLQDAMEQESVPLGAHRTALKQFEEERTELEKRLQLTLAEYSAVKKEKDFFQDENKKLQGTMKAMIMKHDLDIKSAIDKYHSIQREETKLLQAELRETTEREKDQLRDFYEEKISLLCQESERLQNLLHETKELYLKVCDEKNALEAVLQDAKHSNPVRTAHAEEIRQLQHVWENKCKEELDKALEAWNKEKEKEIQDAVQSCKANGEQSQGRVQDLERQLTEKEVVIENLKTEESKKIQSVQDYYINLWTERQKEMQQMYHNRLDKIEEVQKKEFADAMAEMQKAMQEERTEIIKKHREILLKVKKEYDAQQQKVVQLEEAKKQSEQNFSEQSKTMQELKDQLRSTEDERQKQYEIAKEREHDLQEQLRVGKQSLMEKLSLLNREVDILRKDKELLVKRTTEFEAFAKAEADMPVGRNMGSQTENFMVPREEVVELQKLCLELLVQMKEELQEAFSGSSRRAADHLKSAILELRAKS